MLPCWSPITWISMWRGLSMNFSMNTRSSPKLAQPLALGRLEAFAHVLLAIGQPHALAAAAGRRLHHHRIADVARDPHRIVGVGDLAQEAGDDVDARRLGELLRFDLVAHRRDRVRRRADEGDPGVGAGPREALALGQEAIARMDAVRAGLLGGEQDQLGLEIALAPPAPARAAPPRPPSAHAARAHRRPNRPRPSRSPSSWRCASRGTRSRRDWRPGFS